jgi:hypothetical protein
MNICACSFWALTIQPGFFIGLIFVGARYQLSIINTVIVEGVYLAGLILYEDFFGCKARLAYVRAAVLKSCKLPLLVSRKRQGCVAVPGRQRRTAYVF